MADASKGETAASTEANQKTESKDEGGDDADSNDFEKVMKTNYYDTAVDQQRIQIIKPIIRQNNNSPPANKEQLL